MADKTFRQEMQQDIDVMDNHMDPEYELEDPEEVGTMSLVNNVDNIGRKKGYDRSNKDKSTGEDV